MKVAITEELYLYARSIAKAEHQVLQALRERTTKINGSHMQITPDQGQFMAMLAKIMGAKKYLEIGVFTGYSSLAVILAMENKSAIAYALDIDAKMMEIAQEYWAMANVGHKIKPMIGDATESLVKLINEGHNNTFDLAFIDARKSEYITYFEYCYSLIRIGGVILIDNVFMQGDVLKNCPKQSAASINKFNHYLQNLEIDYCVTTIADGLTIVRKT